jgi:hypothetical protein
MGLATQSLVESVHQDQDKAMPVTGNAINNNALAALTSRAGPQVTSAIQKASLKTGVNFAYLMQKADTESSFDTDAGSKSSSAKGLYQFIGSTWMQMVKRYGDKYGLGDYADKISDNGRVSDPVARKEILALRDDPEISALMAGELAAENKQSLINSGIKAKDIGSTELYLAHFMGAGAASEFIKGMKHNPLTPAAEIFPEAARANHNVFYSKTQRERSLGEIYALFDKKFKVPDSTKLPASTLVADDKKNNSETPAITYANNSIMRTLPTAGRIALSSQDNVIALMNEGSSNTYESNTLYNRKADGDLINLAASTSHGHLMTDPASLMIMAHSHEARSERKDRSNGAVSPMHTSVSANRADKSNRTWGDGLNS